MVLEHQSVVHYLISFSLDGSQDQLEQAKTALESVAIPYFEENKEDHESVLFFYADPNLDTVAESLYEFFELPNSPPMLLLTDVPKEKFQMCEKKEISDQTVKEFFARCQQQGFI